MKRFALIIIALLPVLLFGQAVVLNNGVVLNGGITLVNNTNSPVSGGVVISDDFNRANAGTLGANWTNFLQAVGITNNAGSIVPSDGTDVINIYRTQVGGPNGYAKLSWIASTDVGAAVFITFRATDVNTVAYTIKFDFQGGTVFWMRQNSFNQGDMTSIVSSGATIGLSDTWGITWTATGNATVVKLWKVPSANAPTDASTWDGGASTITFTTDPASPVDSGNFIGIGGTRSAGQTNTLENFFGGNF